MKAFDFADHKVHPYNPAIPVLARDVDYATMRPGRFSVVAYAWPGGYPVFYLTRDDGVLCPDCVEKNIDQCADPIARDPQWWIVAHDVNYEDDSLYCDHCSTQIPSAYGDDGGD